MKRPSVRSRRPGLTSVAVMVLLFVVGVMSASLVRLSVRYVERSRAQEQAIQAELLADSGLDRAYARLAADPTYVGDERWEISPEALGLPETHPRPAAVVLINIEANEPSGGGRKIRVRADYPPDAPRRVRSSREVVLSDAP